LRPFFALWTVYRVLRLLEELEPLRYRPLQSLAIVATFTTDLENRRDVATPVTVVRGAPNRDEAVIEVVLPSLHDELVGASYELQIVYLPFRRSFHSGCVVRTLSGTSSNHETCYCSLTWWNSSVTLFPNKYPAPRGDSCQAPKMSSGSDQTRSQKAPSCGISWFRSMART